jgi:hypothetical protein
MKCNILISNELCVNTGGIIENQEIQYHLINIRGGSALIPVNSGLMPVNSNLFRL